MGIGEDFKTFCSNLRITTEQRASISIRYKRITKQLNSDYWSSNSETEHSLYVGSFGRGTAIKGFSDLDMIFRLPFSYYTKYDNYTHNGQSSMLQDVKKSLIQTYPSSDIGANGQTIAIYFTDKVTFEVVPVFLNNDSSYTYPDSNDGGKWRITKPKDEINAVNYMEKETKGNMKWLCKMMRAWKHIWSVPMGGLLIDTLAYRFLQNWEYKDKTYLYYDLMSRDFFYYLSQEPERTYWQAVWSNQFIYSQGKFQYKALRSYKMAEEAVRYELDGYRFSSKKKWREIYGTAFPIL